MNGLVPERGGIYRGRLLTCLCLVRVREAGSLRRRKDWDPPLCRGDYSNAGGIPWVITPITQAGARDARTSRIPERTPAGEGNVGTPQKFNCLIQVVGLRPRY